jgi:serine/threonine-protein kinase
MDYVHGFHLGRWASFVQQAHLRADGRPGQLPWQLAVHIAIQVLDALEYAHTLKGPDGQPLHIVHRDVSPSNVLLDIEGRVLLADFGIAKSSAEEETRTTVGTVKGKFSYMAPEILEGHPPGPGADVYATAVVLHEVLVGRNEFRTQEPAATIQRVLHHTPRRLDVVRPDIPNALADVVARALLKRPEERFQTAAELAKALRRVRAMDAEEANHELRRALERDFRDPRFSTMFDLPELEKLEQSWRTVPDGVVDPASVPPTPAAAPAPVVRHSEPTCAAKPGAVEPAAPTPTRGGGASTAVAAVVGLTVLGVGAGGAYWLSTQRLSAPEVVFVEATPSGIRASPDAAAEAPDAFVDLLDAAIAQPGARPVGRPTTPRTAPTTESPAQIIDRTFARHTTAIRGCFEGQTPPEGQVSLRFTTNDRGAVSDLQITPPSVEAGPVGRCVAGIARRIEFGSQVGARSFRIPLTIRTE